MPFSLPLSVAIFIVIWFVVLFAILPFGVKSQQEIGEVSTGSDPGAPAQPHLLSKALWTTVVAICVFVALSIFVGLRTH